MTYAAYQIIPPSEFSRVTSSMHNEQNKYTRVDKYWQSDKDLGMEDDV